MGCFICRTVKYKSDTQIQHFLLFDIISMDCDQNLINGSMMELLTSPPAEMCI